MLQRDLSGSKKKMRMNKEFADNLTRLTLSIPKVDFGIRCELIMDIVRGDGAKIGFQRLEEVTPYLGKGVIGVGLGESEQKFPADPYAPLQGS